VAADAASKASIASINEAENTAKDSMQDL